MRSRHRKLRPLQRAYLAGLCLLGAASGLGACVDSGGGDTGIVYPTLIAVSPRDFLGPVLCNAPGAMRRYVATLHDVTEGFTLPSSGPVDCLLETKFGFVVPGHRYVARVDGYDRSDIRPLGPANVVNSGSPVMVDVATGEYVPPRWTSTCSGAPEARGDAAQPTPDSTAPDADAPDTDAPDADAPDADTEDAPAVAPDGSPDAEVPDAGAEAAAQVSCEHPDPLARSDVAVTCVRYLTRRVAACTPLCDSVGPGVTGLSVSIDRALDTLQCGNGPGQVETFRVERQGSSDLPQSAPCGQTVIFTEGITPRQGISFKITAFEAGNPAPTWQTNCYGEPSLGTVLPVSCDPLVPTGAAPKTDP